MPITEPQHVTVLTSLLTAPTDADKALVAKAFAFAQEKHKDQKRNSGEAYFVHLYETAKILADLGMSATVVAAGLLHDSVEDVGVTGEEIEREFGAEIRFLVEGVTKLGHVRYKGTDRYNESLRKLFVAMSQDLRVLIIKLADRLHNMRTLQYVPKEKQMRIAKETLEIYAPIASRLGVKILQRELEDIAFSYVYPKEYTEVQKLLKTKREEQEAHLKKFEKSLKKELAHEHITDFRMDTRVKGTYSLHKKLLRHDVDIEKIYDISALRVTVKDVPTCYRILGIIHGVWRPLPGRIKDYIALPKVNGYQSLHTTIFTGDGGIIEVQIRTEDMHSKAEYGVASHVGYKEGQQSDTGQAKNEIENGLKNSAQKNNWVQKLLEYQRDAGDTFIEDIKTDFFQERIFVFTPIGDVIDLPVDSSVIDFAYSIHSDIGSHLASAKVNGKFVAISTILHSGDRVEVETKKSAKPNRKWIEYCKTSMARRHIKSEVGEK